MFILIIKRHVEIPKNSGKLGEEQRDSRGRHQKEGSAELRVLRAEANDRNPFQQAPR